MAAPNTLYAVFDVSIPSAIEQRLGEVSQFPIRFLKTSESSWFVIAPLGVLTRELSDVLGITDGNTSSAIVVRVENYFGRTNKDVWEWLSSNMDVPLARIVAAGVSFESQGHNLA